MALTLATLKPFPFPMVLEFKKFEGDKGLLEKKLKKKLKNERKRRAAMQVLLAKPRRKVVGLWALVATLILLASAQPTAYGLDFPQTTRLTLPESTNIRASVLDLSEGAPLYSQFDFAQSLFASEMALVASVSAVQIRRYSHPSPSCTRDPLVNR